jgi:hypothetical protein
MQVDEIRKDKVQQRQMNAIVAPIGEAVVYAQ